ncbi:MAG TPA: DUF11 domain-containing protein, partial [Planctomycetota bacterium]|nr:DUF11 domain-containing protein [Planctomycetota bacterium]
MQSHHSLNRVWLALLLLPLSLSAATLTVTPITWDVVGLDSNNVNVGPNLYMVGVRVRNTGGGTANNVVAKLNWGTPTHPYINIQSGSSDTLSVASVAVGGFTDFYFNVSIARDPQAYATLPNRTRPYHITVTHDGGAPVSTPQPRQLYVEKIISQARNGVDSITGPTTVFVGNTYTYVVNYHTATGGYDQLEAFAFFPNTLFQIVSVNTTYAVGSPNDIIWADATYWDSDPNSPSYHDNKGPINPLFPTGKAGGNSIQSTYQIKVLGEGTATVSNTINDHSGGSFHYNADYGTGVSSITITAIRPPADLRIVKTVDNPAQTLGNNVVFTLNLTNLSGSVDATGVRVTDQLPAGLQYVSHTNSGSQTYDPLTGVWNVGSLGFGQSTSMTITAKVMKTGISVNTATITAADQSDPDPSNNSSSVNVGPPIPAGSLTLVSTSEAFTSGANVAIGEVVRYRVVYDVREGATPTVDFQHTLAPNMTYIANSSKMALVSSYTGASYVVRAASTTNIDITQNIPNGGKIDNVNLAVGNLVLLKNQTTASQNGIYQVINGTGGNTAVQFLASYTPALNDFIAVTEGQTQASTYWTLTSTSPRTYTQSASSVYLTASGFPPAPGLNVAGDESNLDAITPTHTMATGVAVAGQVVTFTFGNLNNPDNDSAGGTNKEYLVLEFSAVINNTVPGTTSGTALLNRTAIRSNASTASPGLPDTTATLQHTLTIVEPSITGVKNADRTQVARNGVVAYTLDYVAATGANTTTAYDLVITDTLPSVAPNTLVLNTASIVISTAGGVTGATLTSSSATGFTISVASMPPGGTIHVEYTATAGATATVGTNLANNAILTYTSLPGPTGTSPNPTGFATPGAAGTVTGERTGALPSPNTYRITGTKTVTVAVTADLRVMKTVNNRFPVVGEALIYTVTVTNLGPDAAAGVSVSEVLPAGMTFNSASSATGTVSTVGNTTTWTIGAMANGASVTLTVNATVNAQPIQINTATVTSTTYDPVTINNVGRATVTPQEADLAVTNTVNNASPALNSNVTFTVTLTNLGPNDATNVSLTDLLPAGLTYVSHTVSAGTYNTMTGVWTIGNVAVSSIVNGNPTNVQTLTITATVTTLGTKTTTASVSSSDQFDPDLSNNSADSSVTPPAADLSLTVSVDNANPPVNQNVVYTLTLTNAGPNNATNVTVAAALPAGMTFVSSGAGYNSGTGVWTVGTLNNGASTTLTITATATSAALPSKTFTVQVSASDLFDPDSTPNNNVAGEDDQASVTVTPEQADLSLTLTVNNATPNVGSNVVFTVTVNNAGPSNAQNVQVSDVLPAGLTFVSSSTVNGTYTSGTGVWAIGTINNGGSATLTITATVATSGAKTNTAQVSASDQADPDSTPNNNNAGEDDQASVTVTPRQADLSITKTVDNATPQVGSNVVFTLTVSNAGPDSANSVTVGDLLPAGFTFVTSTPSQGTYASPTGVWTIGTINNGANATLTITATVTSTVLPSKTNTATITASDEFDPDTADRSASVTVTPLQADLSITKTVDNATPNVGSNVVFTITVSNGGPDTATNVVAGDTLPAGLTYVSHVASAGTAYNNGTGVWTIGSINNGANATLTITATVTSTAIPSVTNTASITGSTEYDPDVADRTASATVTPRQADLSITKVVDNATPNVGANVVFTIIVSNGGPDTATNVVVGDTLPAGLTYSSHVAGAGTAYNSGTGVWTIGTINNGANATLTITATVTSTAIPSATNTATITGSSEYDPDTADRTASATVTPQRADLSLTKTVDNSGPNVGANVVFTLTVSNAGPSTATNVAVSDVLPAGLTYVSSSTVSGSYANGTGIWTIGTLNNGANATLTITATVATAGAKTNTAQVSASDQFDTDSTPNNNNAGEDDQASVTVTPRQADLSITKTVNNPTPNVGSNVVFTVTVSNSGPSSANNVVVGDALPAGLAYVSHVASAGTAYNNGTGVWTIGTINNGASATLTITAGVSTATLPSKTNTATITASDEFDPDAADRTASATVTPRQADLSVTKSVNNPTPTLGSNVVFTVTVSNAGPDSANNVVVSDALPAGLDYVSHTASGGTNYNSGTGVWTIGTVNNGASATLTLTATVSASGILTNTATITAFDEHDPDTNDHTASASVTQQQANLSLVKTVNNASPNVGQNVIFTIAVQNVGGPNNATNVVVSDVLPVGFAFVSSSPSQGAYNSGTGVWTVGTVNVGANATLAITATTGAAAVPSKTNTATITSLDQFDPDTSDNTDSVTVTPLVANLTVDKTVSNATPIAGNNVVFTIVLKNFGPDNATNVAVSDVLPAGLTFVSSSASQGAYNNGTGVWSVGTVNAGGLATLNVTVTASTVGAKTNTAQVSASDQYDPNSTPNNNNATEDDQSSVIVDVGAPPPPPQADLALFKTVDNAAPLQGQNVTFTLTLTNSIGPSNATGVQVTDILPAGLNYVSSNPSVGTYNSGTGIWNVGTINNGATETLTITATVTSAGAKTNTAQVTASGVADPDSTPNNNNAAEDDQDSVTIVPQEADLEVSKQASNMTPDVGQGVAFTITVKNNGPETATGVALSDVLPAGLSFGSSSATQGAYVNGTGVWTVGTINVGATATLTINTTATAAALPNKTNTASVSALDQIDPDTTNNSDSVTITPRRADLSMTKVVDNASPNVGQNVTFTITLNNAGPSNALNVQVGDLLPAGLTFVSASTVSGTYTNSTGVWNIGTVDAGASATLTVTATVATAGAKTNTAQVTATTTYDPDSTPNNNNAAEDDQASVTVTPRQADLSITKTVDNATPNIGSSVVFTVTVSNTGPDSANNVVVGDSLPVGLTYSSHVASAGTAYNNGTGVWTIGTINNAASATLTITANITTATLPSKTNTATITGSDEFDPDTADRTASATVTPRQADLSITKVVDNATPDVGTNVVFTITVDNAGPDSANNVVVSDTLPVGLTYSSHVASAGTAYNNGTGVWTIGTINNAASATLTITATVT